MDINKLKEERYSILEKMRDALQEELVPCQIRDPESEEEPAILTVVLDAIGETGEMEGSIGEFFFMLPESENDTVQHFCAVITIMDDLSKENLPKLYEAMAKINFRIPCGCYAVDEDESIISYRLTVPMPISLSGDALFDEINVCMANAFSSAEPYADELINIASGEE